MMLGGLVLVRQTSSAECCFLDPPSSFDDGLIASKKTSASVRFEALVIAFGVVGVHEGLDLSFEFSGQEVVLEQHPVLQRLMPTLDLALGLGMVGCTTDVPDTPVVEPFGQIAGDVG